MYSEGFKRMRYSTTPLIQENIDLIEQGLSLIRTLTPEIYANNEHEHFTSGIGKHFRHVLDVYAQVLAGYDSEVDYDARERDERVERDPVYAEQRAKAIEKKLEDLGSQPGGSSVLAVRTEIHDADDRPIPVTSSVDRELAHLASHAVHHYALIGMLARLQGVTPPKYFGVAPSTIRHLSGNA